MYTNMCMCICVYTHTHIPNILFPFFHTHTEHILSLPHLARVQYARNYFISVIEIVVIVLQMHDSPMYRCAFQLVFLGSPNHSDSGDYQFTQKDKGQESRQQCLLVTAQRQFRGPSPLLTHLRCQETGPSRQGGNRDGGESGEALWLSQDQYLV